LLGGGLGLGLGFGVGLGGFATSARVPTASRNAVIALSRFSIHCS
jgi:hypothetical protein